MSNDKKIMNMKKYIKPITKEINVDLSQMIAASIGVDPTPVDPSDSDANLTSRYAALKLLSPNICTFPK